MKLRPYQDQAVKDLQRLFKQYQRIVAVAPTSSGKTTIAAALLRAWSKKRVLWVAHRIELLRQARAELIRAGIPASDVGILSGPDKINPDARILVCSVAMFRLRLVPAVDLIVVDEAHRVAAKSYQGIIYARPDALVLGLTATPWRLDEQPLGDTFDHMLVMAEAVELVADGYIMQAVCYGMPREKALALTRGIKVRTDFASGPLARAMAKRTLIGDLVQECGRLAPGQATLVFAVNREHGRALLKRFLQAGRTAEYLDGETSDEEREAIAGTKGRLALGVTEVVVNVDVLSEGFDCPPVKCIVLARPTKSLTRFLQQVGRSTRKYRGRRPVVLDHAGNCWRFGLPDTPQDWSLQGIPKQGSGEQPIRLCSSCHALIAAACILCPECGAEQTQLETGTIEEDEAQLQKLEREQRDRERVETVLRRIATERGKSEDWVAERLKATG